MATESEKKERQSEEHAIPEGEMIYRTVRRDGDHALSRTTSELVSSGVAAGFSMGFSFAAEALLRSHLPDAPWAPLITKLGYCLGFLIVVLGRQQLFTEQTLIAILPLLSRDRPEGVIRNVARLWGVVLASNLAGSAAFAAAAAWTPAFSREARLAFDHIGQAALAPDFATILVGAIFAGFLIATMIWLLPGAGESRLWIVILLTYVVGLGGFPHIVAGSADCLYVIFTGERSLTEYLVGYLVPTFLGNSIGGVALVAALAHAQHAPAESR